MIELYTAATPNGWKVSIALEEMDIPYQVHHIDLLAGDQKRPEYLKINPNGRIPAIVDSEEDALSLFESGAILIYLAEKCGKFIGRDLASRAHVLQWLMFQMGGIGPMMGQANVFYRYFPEKLPAAIARYQSEVMRLFGVLDGRLAQHEFLVDDYSIADIANWPWVRSYYWSGVSVDAFPNLQRWMDAIERRPAVQAGVSVPERKWFDMITGHGGGEEAFAEDVQALVQTGAQR